MQTININGIELQVEDGAKVSVEDGGKRFIVTSPVVEHHHHHYSNSWPGFVLNYPPPPDTTVEPAANRGWTAPFLPNTSTAVCTGGLHDLMAACDGPLSNVWTGITTIINGQAAGQIFEH